MKETLRPNSEKLYVTGLGKEKVERGGVFEVRVEVGNGL